MAHTPSHTGILVMAWCILALICQYSHSQALPEISLYRMDLSLDILSPQAFIDAVRGVWTEDQNLELRIPGGTMLDLTNTTLNDLAEPVTNGVLSLSGISDGNGAFAAVNLANRALVSVGLAAGGDALIHINNMLLLGLCSVQSLYIPEYQITPHTSSQIMFLTGRSRTVGGVLQVVRTQLFVMNNVTLLATGSEVATQQYIHVLQDIAKTVPWVSPFAERWLNVLGNTQANISKVGPSMLRFQSSHFPIAVGTNVTMMDAQHPDSVAAAGLAPGTVLGPMRMCNLSDPSAEGGALVQDAALRTNLTQSPVWVSETSEQLQNALSEVSSHLASNAGQAIQDWPASVLLIGNATLLAPPPTAVTASGTQYVLPGMTTIMGPWNHYPPTVVIVSLDLANATAPLILLPALDVRTPDVPARLVLHKLVLKNLGAAPLPAGGSGTAPTITSALPLWAIGRQAGPGAVQVYLSRCLVFVPLSDYTALLSAALRGDGWKANATGTAALLAGISVFELSSSFQPSPSSSRIILSSYSGWGINATSIAFAPNEPLAPCTPLPDWHGPLDCADAVRNQQDDASDGDSKPSSLQLGLGLGLGLGCSVVLLAAGAAVLWVIRSRRAAGTGRKPATMAMPLDAFSCCIKATTTLPCNDSGSKPAASQLVTMAPSMQNFIFRSMNQQKQASEDPFSSTEKAAGNLSSSPRDSAFTTLQEYKHAVASTAEALNAGHADKLVLSGKLGSGASGVVFIGTWRGMQVAVKTIVFTSEDTRTSSGDSGSSQGEVAPASPHPKPMNAYDRVVLEAALCSSMTHPNVVSTYRYDFKEISALQEAGQQLDINEAPGSSHSARCVRDYKLYLIQELCDTCLDETTFHNYAVAPGSTTLELEPMLLALLDVCRGLEYLHSRGVIHGDLKPCNVLVKIDARDPRGFMAKLTDFGLSTALAPDKTHVSNYSSGTPFYVAPEVILHHTATPASDMYAFGVMMWSLFSGDTPWSVGGQGAFIWNPKFPHLNAPAPQSFVHLMAACLDRNPTRRPSSSKAVAQLQELCGQLGLASYLSAWRKHAAHMHQACGAPAQST